MAEIAPDEEAQQQVLRQAGVSSATLFAALPPVAPRTKAGRPASWHSTCQRSRRARCRLHLYLVMPVGAGAGSRGRTALRLRGGGIATGMYKYASVKPYA